MSDWVKARIVSVAVVLFLLGALASQAVAQTSSSSSVSASSSSSPELAKFFADYFEERLRDEPEFATNVGRHDYDDRWSDLSKQGRDLRRTHLQQRFDQLQKFSP